MSYHDPYQQDPYQQQPQQDPYQQQPQQYPYQQQPPQYGYPQQGYPPGYPQPGPTGQTNVMAILSLVFAFVFWPVGIVFGHIAKKQIRERNEEGGGLATAGLILSYIFGAIALLICGIWVIAVVILANNGSTT
jgi:hypothetical protein